MWACGPTYFYVCVRPITKEKFVHYLVQIENLWSVPEEGGSGSLKRKIQREASVLRYKQKRENRLFSKRIRYQVRKLNAEKRPRMKVGNQPSSPLMIFNIILQANCLFVAN